MLKKFTPLSKSRAAESLPEFVDVYGRNVPIETNRPMGEIMVPLRSVTNAGITVYNKSEYNALLVSDKTKYENLFHYMLTRATDYFVDKQFGFNTEKIEERCDSLKKKLLLEESTAASSSKPQKSFKTKLRPEAHSSALSKPEDEFIITYPNNFPNKGFSSISKLKQLNKARKNRENGIPTEYTRAVESKDGTTFQIKLFKNENAESSEPEKETANTSQLSTHFEGNKTAHKPPSKYHQNSHENNENGEQNNTGNAFVKPSGLRRNFAKKSERGYHNKFKSLEVRCGVRHKCTLTNIGFNNRVYYVRLDENEQTWNNIKEMIINALPSCRPASSNIFRNEMYLAGFDNEWFRAQIVGTFPQIKAFLFDSGNLKEVEQLRFLPSEIAEIPAQAIRMLGQEPVPECLTVGDKVTIQVMGKNNSMGYYGEIIEVAADRSTPIIRIPDYMTRVKDGQRVVIIAEEKCAFYLRTKECLDKLVSIQQRISDFVPHAPKITNLTRGQLILAPKSPQDANYYRAVAKSIAENLVNVKYLDYNETASVNMDSIRCINEELATEPITYFLSPSVLLEHNVIKFDDRCSKFIDNCIRDKQKFIVAYKGPKNFDLLGNDEDKTFSMSDKLRMLIALSTKFEDDDDW